MSVHPWQVIRPVYGLFGEAKHIEDKIYQMADEIMPIYEENIRGELVLGYRTSDALVQHVISENSDIITNLETTTDFLIENILI